MRKTASEPESKGELVPSSAPRSRSELRLRRFRNPLGVVLASAVVLALVGAAFVAGRLTATPVRETLAEAEEAIAVFAPVERRVVDSRDAFPASIKAGDVVPVVIPNASGAVVVRQGTKPGETVSAGSLLAVLSGLPYFALPGPLPLYRDLTWGDTGDDVVRLQAALSAAGLEPGSSGRVDRQTFWAVSALFERSGFDFSCCSTIPYQQLVPVGALPAEVVSAAVVGSVLSDKNPVVQLRDGEPFASFTADAVAASTLTLGQELTANIGGEAVTMTVESIGEFVAPTSSTPGGREVRMRPAADSEVELTVGDQVTLFGPGTNEETLAVPLIAIRQDNGGNYVQIEVVEGGKPKLERVDVEVIRHGGGWASIEGGPLQVGDEVLVSG